MKLQVKLLLCFVLVSTALPLIAYIGILNPRIRHAAQFVEESHQEVLSEHRLLTELEVVDRSLQDLQTYAFRVREERQKGPASNQRQRATSELYAALAAFKAQYSTFTEIQTRQWKDLADFENLSAPDASEQQERALRAKIDEGLPVLERAIGSYMDLFASSPEAANQLLEEGLQVQLRKELLPGIRTASDATERRMDEETKKVESSLDRAYKQTTIAVVVSLFLSVVLATMISQSVAKPIRRLRDAAIAIGKGDFAVEVNIASKDELGDLGRAFNRMGTDLQRHVTERLQARDELERTNQKLSSSLQELHARSYESALISEMANMLQSCVSLDEASQVITRSVQRALPDTSGALFLFSASRNLLQEVAAWGDSPPRENVFPPGDCWALRRGNPYLVLDEQIAMPCVHLRQDASAAYVCIPLSAQGDTLGVLHLRTNREHVMLLEKRQDGAPGRAQQLGVTLAEQAALAMANLKLRDTLKHQSTRDPLTGLFNRRYMEESLERELGRSLRKNRPLSLFMLDLDHFKKFNDTFGHEAGDLMLREFAYHMQKRMRGEDIVCRYGGEEFVVILVEAPLEMAQKRAEEFLGDARRLSVLRHGQSIGGVTLSMGIAAFPQHGAAADGLLRAADRALYRAKELGRDRFVVADLAEQETEVPVEKTSL